jgi:hypothetical protein
MKKILIINIVAITCMAFITANKTTDYRDAYIGTYSCQGVYFQRNTEQGKAPIVTTNTLIVNVSKDAVDSVLLLQIDSKSIKCKLTNRNIYSIQSEIHGGGYFYANDSLSFSFAIGRANSCKFIGKKK